MLSVLIVHFETPDLLRQCLASIFSEPTELSFEVIVIDNASRTTDVRQIALEFPDATFKFNSMNVGFAVACNQVVEMGSGRYILLLNPDTVILPQELSNLVLFMESHPKAGACGPRLLYPNGELQLSCREFPTRLALALRISRLGHLIRHPVRSYLMADWDHAHISQVDWIIGGCMMLRREAFEDVDFFDEGFFMYYEDTDLCYRLKKKGWKVYYNPKISVVHHHQRMSAGLLPNRLSLIHAKSLWRLFQKHEFAWY